MAPLDEALPEQDLQSALSSAGEGLGFCLLSFPIATFTGALAIGLWSSAPETSPLAGAPLWILLSVCALFCLWAVVSARSARRRLAQAGMPLHAVQRHISAMWIVAAVFMLAGGLCALGYLAVTSGPDGGRYALFGPLERPVPLAVTFVLYVLAGASLLGRNWMELRKAERISKLQAGREAADWFRQTHLHMAHSGREGVGVFVIATFMLALVTALGNGAQPQPDAARLTIMGLFALGSLLCAFWVRRSRRHFEAAGLAQEEIQGQMASAWRGGAVMMIIIGAGGLGLWILGQDVLSRVDRLWTLGTALVYTLAGIVLYLWNRPKRGLPE